jgi:hypothetical protein
MDRFKDLDDAICKHIESGSLQHPIYSQRLLAMACSQVGNTTESDPRVWRLIDRRLQALKKAGRLIYRRPQWVLVSPASQT